MQQSLALIRTAGDTRGEANTMLHLARAYWGLGEYQQALAINIEALAIAEGIEDHLTMTHLLCNTANIYLVLGDYGTAYEYYNKSMKAAEVIEYVSGQAAALDGMAILYGEWKEYTLALEHLKQSSHIYEMNKDALGMAVVTGNMGTVYQKSGDNQRALEHFQSSLMLSQQIDAHEEEIAAYYNLGNIEYASEDYEQAEHFYQKGLEKSEQTQMKSKIFRGQYLLGRTYSRQGKNNEARDYLTKLLDHTTEFNDKHLRLEVHRELVELFEKINEYEQAFHHYRGYHKLEREVFSEESHERTKKLQVLHRVEQAEKQREIYRITSEHLQQENEGQKKELASKAMYLSQKNELLGKIRKTLRTIAQRAEQPTAIAIQSVVQDIEGALADDQTWEVFKEQFQKIQQPFMQALTEQCSSLSPLEVRVCALMKLNLSSKEISRILNVAPRSIEMYRYRIRKKLALDASDNLTAFLMRLEHK